MSIKESMGLVGGRARRSKQAEHQAKHPYGAEAKGEIGEHDGLVVLDYLAVGIDPALTTICLQSSLPWNPHRVW